MRKAQFKSQAERTADGFVFYKAMQYRWKDDETADPQIGDETYHLTKAQAIAAADAIKLNLGFCAVVDRITIDYDDLNEGIEFGEEFELFELDDNASSETIYTGATNEGKELGHDAIIVFYRHHRYMNYAYIIESIKFVCETDLKTEADLRNDADRTSSIYCHLVDDLDQLAEEFRLGICVPFDKINSGSVIVREFLNENKHPDYV